MERWGLCFGPSWQTSVAELIGPARAAEHAGFDRISTGEYRNDALTWMALLAAATSSDPAWPRPSVASRCVIRAW